MHDNYWLSVSMLYAKAALRFPEVEGSYAIVNSDGDWYFVCDSLDEVTPESMYAAELNIEKVKPERKSGIELGTFDLEKAKANSGVPLGPMSLSQMLLLIQSYQPEVVVPHVFDITGMTTLRGFFEDILQIPIAGPDGMANVIAQNKAITRNTLQSAGVSIPEGQVLHFETCRDETMTFLKNDELMNTTTWADLCKDLGITIAAPFILKPTTEDNSRGVSLIKTESVAALASGMHEALKFGSVVLIETFIPGREIRVGVVEIDGEPRAVPATLEYIMRKDKPIRTINDKLLTDSDGKANMRQNTSERVIPADIDEQLEERLKSQVLKAHRAIGLRDYSLFDFRVHEDTQEVYIIEACSFWSYSKISMISVLIEASQSSERFGEDRWPLTLRETILSSWRHASSRKAQR